MGNVCHATRATRLRSCSATSLRFAERPPTLGGPPTGFAFPTLPDTGSGGRWSSGAWSTCYVPRGAHVCEVGVLHLSDSPSGRRL